MKKERKQISDIGSLAKIYKTPPKFKIHISYNFHRI